MSSAVEFVGGSKCGESMNFSAKTKGRGSIDKITSWSDGKEVYILCRRKINQQQILVYFGLAKTNV